MTPGQRKWHAFGVNEPSYPVTVAVRRADGSVEEVRVGTAVRAGDGFRLTLGDLSIGALADAAGAPARRPFAAPPPPAGGFDGGMVFPNYGRSKGAPVAGATQQDLEFYAGGCRRTLADPAKSRWHDKERALLSAIEAELARQGIDDGPRSPTFFQDRGPGRSTGASELPFDDREVPPRSDDDIPF